MLDFAIYSLTDLNKPKEPGMFLGNTLLSSIWHSVKDEAFVLVNITDPRCEKIAPFSHRVWPGYTFEGYVSYPRVLCGMSLKVLPSMVYCTIYVLL